MEHIHAELCHLPAVRSEGHGLRAVRSGSLEAGGTHSPRTGESSQ